jgi:hypothetical protein
MNFAYVMMFALVSVGCQAETKANSKTLPVKTVETSKAADKVKLPGEKEEDCDEKAKKPIEIKPESISLGSGTAGCTLDEVK